MQIDLSAWSVALKPYMVAKYKYYGETSHKKLHLCVFNDMNSIYFIVTKNNSRTVRRPNILQFSGSASIRTNLTPTLYNNR